MSKLKEIIQMEKENMPEYQFKFLYHRVMPGFIFVLGGGILTLVLGAIFNHVFTNEFISYIPLIIWAITTIVLLVLFVIYGKKYSRILNLDKEKEFTEKYKIIKLETAIENLKKKNIIVNNMLVVNGKYYPLHNCLIYFFSKTLSGKFYFRLEFYDIETHTPITMLELDQDICTYFVSNNYKIINQELFDLFNNDKKEFLKLLFKYNKPSKMQKKLIKNK